MIERTYTRDVSEKMINMLKTGAFAPILRFVQEKQDELALCFRGNDTDNGKVKIYKHNHLIWELSISNAGEPTVQISANHARFMEKWEQDAIKPLMDDLGFKGPKGKTYYDLENVNTNVHDLVKRNKSRNSYSYDIVDLKFIPSSEKPLDDTFVAKSYEILSKMQESYLTEKQPNNYLKKYYFKYNKNSNEDHNTSFDSDPQECLEKRVQQELFNKNHRFIDGLFIYDLEFEQPKMEGVEVKTKNKPDMFAIRFDKRKNSPVSICMVEVKSKIEALRYGSGLDDHLEGMEAYLSMEGKNELLMNYRKREACKILNQYHELELYGVAKEYQVEDFMKLNNEIVFIFTNGLNLESNVHRGITVGSILKGYDAYDKIVSGDNAGGEIVAVKKKY